MTRRFEALATLLSTGVREGRIAGRAKPFTWKVQAGWTGRAIGRCRRMRASGLPR